MKAGTNARHLYCTQGIIILQPGGIYARFPPMPPQLRRLPSLAEQAAEHLREGFQSGRWVGLLPGVVPLASELKVSKDIVRAALKVLEEEGWIENCGAGRRRMIVPLRSVMPARRALRVGIMLYLPLLEDDKLGVVILLGIRRAIEAAGHVCVFSEQCLVQMNDNLSKISRCVKTTAANAWIVCTASRVVLEWFAAQSFPVLAFGGRFQDLPVASSATRLAPAIESAVNELVDSGHRRIVMLAETYLLKPTPTSSLTSYLSTLEARGIAATDFNLPHFNDTPEGLEDCLNRLFRVTPPTALIVQHAAYLVAVFSYLMRRGLRVPHDVSVITVSSDPIFRMCLPPLDHFSDPCQEHIDRITCWVNNVAKGLPDIQQVVFDAVHIHGGIVGPAKR